MRGFRGVLLLGVVAVLWSPTSAGAGGSSGSSTPTVTGPVTGGKGHIDLVNTGFDLGQFGYVAEEFFLEGDAVAYEPVDTPESGRWRVRETSEAPYKTRIVVYRPASAKDFNGTVYLEWLNVSSGFENAPLWALDHMAMLRSGAAWVGVSAQAIGVQGGASVIEGTEPGGVKGADRERYGTLTHPGDSYSYDIFTQAARAVAGDAEGPKPLGPLDAKHVVASGKSQSSFFLTSYANGIQPRTNAFDGFLLASRHAAPAAFTDESNFGLGADMPERTRIRTDLDVPVFVVQTEYDVQGFSSADARQPDTDQFRLWEIAGTSHADSYTGGVSFNDVGDGSAELTVLDPAQATGGPLRCAIPVNAGPAYAVLDAAVVHMNRWVRGGTPPPKAARLETTGSGDDITFVRDEQGNARGGVRHPLVDVPIARNDGERNEGGSFCFLFGTTAPLDAATLAELYPGGTDEWREKFAKATEKTVDAGFWLRPEADNFVAASEQITLP